MAARHQSCWTLRRGAAIILLLCVPNAVRAAEPAVRFQDISLSSGLDFRHVSPQSELRHLHLSMGSGVAWIDFDRDNAPDLYFAQGTPWTGVLVPKTGPADRLFRQRSQRFQDCTLAAGISNLAYAMGIAAGDFNNDGFQDLYISNFGPNQCYLNNGDGTFTEQATTCQLDDPGYGASCTWFDANADGLLDLYVTNYLAIDVKHYKTCIDESAEGTRLPIGCPPREVPGQWDKLYLSSGNGQFVDASQQAGLQSVTPAQGLGVVAADLDDDGDQDVYVANDSVPNHQWINDGTGRFTEMALIAGTAVNKAGMREAGMGVDLGDADGDGLPDIFVTNFYEETNTLYRHETAGLFSDVTDELGLGAPSRSKLAFGTNFIDAENDGDLDLFIANGHIHDRLRELGRDIPYEQTAQLMLNTGRRFVDTSKLAGEYFSRPELGRGSAVADYDRDGRIDIAVNHLDRPAALLQNQTPAPGSALLIQLAGKTSNRDGIGAKIHVQLRDRQLLRIRMGSSSYLSGSDAVVHMGIGRLREADVIVLWPSGHQEMWRGVTAGDVHVFVEGSGEEVPQRAK